MIVLFSFIGSLFSNDIAVWAVNNNGGWYTFGFVLGFVIAIGALTESSSKAVSKQHITSGYGLKLKYKYDSLFPQVYIELVEMEGAGKGKKIKIKPKIEIENVFNRGKQKI